jgi:predicted NUDIX family NTP pyrophosphohydrolase
LIEDFSQTSFTVIVMTGDDGRSFTPGRSGGDCDPAAIVRNTFAMEWPPRSGRQLEFPQIDRAEFFGLAEARRKIKAAQVALIDELGVILNHE